MSIEKYLKTQLMPNGQIAGALDLPTLLIDFVALFKMIQDIHQRLDIGVMMDTVAVTTKSLGDQAQMEPEPESKLILT